MAKVQEGPANQSQAQATLRDGLEVLALNTEIEFLAYSRTVLPLDGYIFWNPTVTFSYVGSLHYSQNIEQNVDETVGLAQVMFSSEEKVTQFEGPGDTIFIASIGGFRFAFSRQSGFYGPSGEWHYVGTSVIPAFASTLLDTPGAIDPEQAVVSNSMPVWLALNSWTNPFPDQAPARSGITLYPSFMVPPNLAPPYGSVYIPDDYPVALEAVPLIGPSRSHSQLVYDKVQITLYGLQNNAALDFHDFVIQYLTINQDGVGLRNTPVIRDANRTQAELQTKAMKKTFEIEVNYYQQRLFTMARTLIKEATIKYIVGNQSATKTVPPAI